ncbi:MAG: 5-(carboxyamino)imidazole ribonucleotide synthase [Pirellulaceae bacterium]
MSKPLPEDTMIRPGAWIGMLGGGQLGRMFTHAAHQLGYHVAVFEPELNSPAAQAADRHFHLHDYDSPESAVREMAQLCDVVSLEFENIDSKLVSLAAESTLTRPGHDFLSICQHRALEKQSLSDAGFPATPFVKVHSHEDALQAAEKFGWPIVLKTANGGYDGKGQAIVRDANSLDEAWQRLGDCELIAEQWIEYQAEVSTIIARNADGHSVAFPIFENEHANHILDVTRCPCSEVLSELESEAKRIGQGIAERFNVVGLFCVEFFVTRDGKLLVNEMAPRPHNSGHLTIEAFSQSQFDLQVRAICNLPLPAPQLIRPAAMANLLGDLWQSGEPNWAAALGQENSHLHLYGKSEPRVGRKMGHLTLLHDESSLAAAESARQIRSQLCPDS